MSVSSARQPGRKKTVLSGHLFSQLCFDLALPIARFPHSAFSAFSAAACLTQHLSLSYLLCRKPFVWNQFPVINLVKVLALKLVLASPDVKASYDFVSIDFQLLRQDSL